MGLPWCRRVNAGKRARICSTGKRFVFGDVISLSDGCVKKHPTSNSQHRTSSDLRIGRSLDVECSMMDVGCSRSFNNSGPRGGTRAAELSYWGRTAPGGNDKLQNQSSRFTRIFLYRTVLLGSCPCNPKVPSLSLCT